MPRAPGNHIGVGARARWVAVLGASALVLVLTPIVTAQAAGPSVTISSPTADQVVSGATSLTFSGTADTSGSDFPASYAVLVENVTVATGPCSGTTFDCADTTSFDATGISGHRDLTVELLHADGTTVLATSDPLSIQGLLPTVTAPVAPNPTKGTVSVTATAATDSTLLTEFPAVVSLFRGGTTLIGTFSCPLPLAHQCDASFSWDATGLSAPQTLTARVLTDLGRAATSSGATVATSTPAPKVTITSPTDGSSIAGATLVSVTATTDPALTDYPSQVELLVDGSVADTKACPTTESICLLTLSFDATGLSATQTLTARVTSHRNVSATSAAVLVTPGDPQPTVTVTSPVAAASVAGTVVVGVTAETDAALTEYPSSVDLLLDGAVVDTVACPAPLTVHTCAVSLSWDASGPGGFTNVGARVTTTRSRTAESPVVGVVVKNPAPTVTVTSPKSGSVHVGVVRVTASASTDAAVSDLPKSIELLANGVLVGVRPCAGARSCAVAFAWNGTGRQGPLSLIARVRTTLAVVANSPAVAIKVVNVVPTVRVTSPGAGSVVSGKAVQIRVRAVTDARRADFPRSLALMVDGVRRGTAACSGTVHVCDALVRWNASRASGAHTIVVTMATTRAFTTRSPARVLYASSASRVVLSAPATVRAGSRVVIRGKVVATTSGAGVKGVVVSVVRRPALGRTTTVRVTTGTGGVFAVSYDVRSNAKVVVQTTRTSWLGSSSGATRIYASAPMACSQTVRTLAVGAVGRGTCSVPGLPARTRVSLRYFLDGRLFTLASGAAKGSPVRFSFTFSRRGTYYLRVDLAANAVYVSSRSSLLKVSVR